MQRLSPIVSDCKVVAGRTLLLIAALIAAALSTHQCRAHSAHNGFLKSVSLTTKSTRINKSQNCIVCYCALLSGIDACQRQKTNVCSTYLCLACHQSTPPSLCLKDKRRGNVVQRTQTSRLQTLVLHPNTVLENDYSELDCEGGEYLTGLAGVFPD